MAIELASVAPVQPKPGAGRAPGREAPADGEGSFASALSASSATPTRSAAKKPEADERGQGEGAPFDDSIEAAGGDAGEGVEAGKRDAVATDADAADVAAAQGAATAAIGDPAPTRQPAQQTTSPLLPAESALLLAQGALVGTSVHDANQRAAAASTAGAQSAATPPVTASLSRAVPSTETAPAIAAGNLPTAASQQPAAVLPAVNAANPEPDLALQALNARSAGARALPAAAPGVVSTSAADPFAASTASTAPATSTASATSAFAASFSSAIPQQTQRVSAQAQVFADRAALQSPNATTALDSRAAESLAAAGMVGGAPVDASASPLLRRFERVLSMTHAASGEGQTFGSGGATTASAWMTPVNGAGAPANASMGGMTDRLADSMNGLLAQVVAQKSHNALLTVDVGGQPVSVNVQVQGNEAQVVFRADQAETRAMLAQALPQLKQMMGAEGLVLSDASVAGQWAGGGAQAGAGGSGGSNGAGDSDARRGSSPARMDAGAPVTGTAAAATARTSGTRSLDLYV